MPRKTHIRIPSVEGQLGYPGDLVERYKEGAGNGSSNGNGARNGGTSGTETPPADRAAPAGTGAEAEDDAD